MTKQIFTSVITSAALMAVIPMTAFAVTIPSYPSCVNSQGTLKVSYDSGVHGIVGMTDEKKGSDKVYQLSGNDQLMQCFCPENGNGIQTNWLKVKETSNDDVESLKKDGWIFVADGSVWGLDSGAYLAKNSDYSCKTTTTTTTTNNTTNNVTNNTTNNPVQQVLSLANTGNIVFLYGLIAAGLTSLTAGVVLRLKK